MRGVPGAYTARSEIAPAAPYVLPTWRGWRSASDWETARRGMLREGFAISEEIGSKRVGVVHLRIATELAAYFREWECAARLYGAARGAIGANGLSPRANRRGYPGALYRADREALDAAAFAAAESAGRSLSYDEAIVEARSWLEHPSR